MVPSIKNKRIVIIGGTGSLGKFLIDKWKDHNELLIISRDEAKHWTLKNELLNFENVKFSLGDIRDVSRIRMLINFFDPNYIVLAAALKQVDTCEYSPEESIKTNVLGVSNVLNIVMEEEVRLKSLECVLLVSTDKACAPTNVYGMSKAISERLVVAMSRTSTKTRFIGVRYGNVLDSRGSIVPLFRYQAAFGEAFTITDRQMTRFLMTLSDSGELIESAIMYAESGDFWIPKLNAMSILDLAQIFSSRYGKPIREIGVRAGEKLHEELISEPESLRVIESEKNFVLHPDVISTSEAWNLSSRTITLSQEELLKFLEEKGVFEWNLDKIEGKKIEEIRTI